MNDQIFWIIPAFCEGKVIAGVVESLRAQLTDDHHVVVVDDGSTDATAERACEAGATVLRHAVNLGQGAALQTGLEYAVQRSADYIITYDADGQHDPGDALSMLQAVDQAGVDVGLGSRFLGDTSSLPPARRAVLIAAVYFTRLTSGLKLTDTHNGLRVLSQAAARKIQLTQDRMAHASEILNQIAAHNLSYIETPVTIRYTEYSLNKGQRLSNAFNIVSDLFTNWIRK